ncbi:uncharacterized protein METZ01_LOCUS4459 [marine metagenome]|uniref:Uncharacterized protein n=1 Tax=marine metagenome TaxID=408172 RepID=A0A381NAN9_9ZZZZ
MEDVRWVHEDALRLGTAIDSSWDT